MFYSWPEHSWNISGDFDCGKCVYDAVGGTGVVLVRQSVGRYVRIRFQWLETIDMEGEWRNESVNEGVECIKNGCGDYKDFITAIES